MEHNLLDYCILLLKESSYGAIFRSYLKNMKIELPQRIELNKHTVFWKQIGMIIIGTTISLLLTIGARSKLPSVMISTLRFSSRKTFTL